MKKKILVDLITAHYNNEPVAFFNATLEVLKEFKDSGDDGLVRHIQYTLMPRLKVAPKREVDTYQREMTQEEYEKYFGDAFNLMPQEVNIDD